MKFLFKPTSYHQGTVLAVGSTLVWKFLSFINALLLAAYFGATFQTDIYFYVIMVWGFCISFVQRLNQTVLIPEAMFLQEEQPRHAAKFITMWLYIYLIGALAVGIMGTVLAVPGWAHFSRFGSEELAVQRPVLVLGAWWFGLQLVSSYLQAIAEMYKYFSSALLGILNAFFPLLCLLLFGKQVGPASILYGFVAANLVQIAVLLILYCRTLGISIVPAYHPVAVRMRRNMLAGQSLALVDVITSLLPVYLISGLGTGAITALNYCRQFTDSATEVFTARMSNIAKIAFTEHAARQQKAVLNKSFLQATWLLAVILAPLAVFSCYFAPQIVSLFFQRGQFTAQDTHQTVLFLRPMLFVMLLSAAGYLQNSALAACRKIKESFPYALLSALAVILLLWIVIPSKGAFSYPYLLVIGLMVGFALNAFLFHQELPFISYGKHLACMARISAYAGLSLLPCLLLRPYVPSINWVQLGVCGTVFISVYVGIVSVSSDGKQLRQFLFRRG